MKKFLAILFILLTACTNSDPQPEATTPPLPTATPLPQATATPLPPTATATNTAGVAAIQELPALFTLDPSVAPAPQLVQDLATRLGVSADQITVKELRFVVWEAESLRCPPPPEPPPSLDYVLIVTQDGARFEPTSRPFDLNKDTPIRITFLVHETPYPYYVVNGQALFCPDKQ